MLNLFCTLHFILQFAEPRCEDFNGIPHPENILVCCTKQCGTEGLFSCGGGECEKAPGGPSECCKDRDENDGISTNQRVCSEVTPPPCTIGEIYVKMINYMPWNNVIWWPILIYVYECIFKCLNRKKTARFVWPSNLLCLGPRKVYLENIFQIQGRRWRMSKMLGKKRLEAIPQKQLHKRHSYEGWVKWYK